MKCYIHGGLNKAGSSYIQNVFLENEKALLSEGISYSNGRPGHGNATPLVLALRAGQIEKVGTLLDSLIANATKNGARSVLLSSESLYHYIIDAEHFDNLVKVLQSRGFERPNLLIYFREPVSHAISAYCHRAGHRHNLDFQEWIRDHYEFIQELPKFIETFETQDFFDIELKAYKKFGMIEDLRAWLQCEELVEPKYNRVNVSPNLIEAEILIRVHRIDRNVAKLLRSAFKSVSEKPSDSSLRTLYSEYARAELYSIESELNKIGSLVQSNFSMKLLDSDVVIRDQQEYHLNHMQINAMISAMTQRPMLISKFTERLSKRIKRLL